MNVAWPFQSNFSAIARAGPTLSPLIARKKSRNRAGVAAKKSVHGGVIFRVRLTVPARWPQPTLSASKIAAILLILRRSRPSAVRQDSTKTGRAVVYLVNKEPKGMAADDFCADLFSKSRIRDIPLPTRGIEDRTWRSDWPNEREGQAG
jgi:hypothetical protein